MLNREKFAKQIMDIALEHATVVVTKDGSSICCCGEIMCQQCMFYRSDFRCGGAFGKWLDSEHVELEIDWSKVPVDTPVLVRNNENGPFEKRYLNRAELYSNLFITYPNGKTSWSSNLLSENWKFCELAREEDKQKYAKRGNLDDQTRKYRHTVTRAVADDNQRNTQSDEQLGQERQSILPGRYENR